MPEQIHRVLTDALETYLFTSEERGNSDGTEVHDIESLVMAWCPVAISGTLATS